MIPCGQCSGFAAGHGAALQSGLLPSLQDACREERHESRTRTVSALRYCQIPMANPIMIIVKGMSTPSRMGMSFESLFAAVVVLGAEAAGAVLAAAPSDVLVTVANVEG